MTLQAKKLVPLLKVENLSKQFFTKRSLFGKPKEFIPVVDKVSFELFENEILGIAGESGSGKSTLCRLIMNLIAPDSGSIWFDNQEICKNSMLRKNIQMIFQDASDSLNARFTVQELISEPLVIYKVGNQQEQKKKVAYLLDLVGLSKNDLGKYIHEFSGGQKQRIGIARALALSPKIIIADEPTSALDVSIQAQILSLFHNIQTELKISFIFVSHDLHAISLLSQRILVLYLGKVVELGEREEVFCNSQHPYTQILIDSVLRFHPNKKKLLKPIQGEITNFSHLPQGCYFQSRCPYKTTKCERQYPPLEQKIFQKGKEVFAACWNSKQACRTAR